MFFARGWIFAVLFACCMLVLLCPMQVDGNEKQDEKPGEEKTEEKTKGHSRIKEWFKRLREKAGKLREKGKEKWAELKEKLKNLREQGQEGFLKILQKLEERNKKDGFVPKTIEFLQEKKEDAVKNAEKTKKKFFEAFEMLKKWYEEDDNSHALKRLKRFTKVMEKFFTKVKNDVTKKTEEFKEKIDTSFNEDDFKKMIEKEGGVKKEDKLKYAMYVVIYNLRKAWEDIVENGKKLKEKAKQTVENGKEKAKETVEDVKESD